MAISLESIITGKDNNPPRIVFYAPSGFGKNTFASQAPSPIFIQCEEGVGNMTYDRFPLAKSFKDVLDALGLLAETKHKFSTVVIDTIDALERLIFEEVVKEHNAEKKPITSIGDIGFGAGYVKALNYWGQLLSALDYLRKEKGIMPILLAHSQIKSFTPPDSDSYDRYRFNMHDRASELVKDWADVVLFGNYKVHTRSSGEGFNKTTKGIGGDRFLYTQERPAHWGKNRFDLPYEIPFKQGSQWNDFEALLYPPKKPEMVKKASKLAKVEVIEDNIPF